MKMRKAAAIALSAALFLGLFGCSGESAEDFYALPKLTDTYVGLQVQITALLETGAEYSAPASGQNRQSVQMEDLDGDGVREALAFLRAPGDGGPRVYVFRYNNGMYERSCVLVGSGTGFESVGYVDMDGSGAKYLAVGCSTDSGMNLLTLYDMKALAGRAAMVTGYNRFVTADLDGDGRTELVTFTLSSGENDGAAVCYSLGKDGELTSTAAPISSGARNLRRVRSAVLRDGTAALFAESTMGTRLVTDIFCTGPEGIRNITLDETIGASNTFRSSNLWSRDIDGDGVLDVPRNEQLPMVYGTSGIYDIVYWSDYDSLGQSRAVEATYINSADSWFFVFPEEWLGNVTVHRQDSVGGERAVIFSFLDRRNEAVDFLKIYTLTGDNREERAAAAGRFVLRRQDEKVFAAEITARPEGFQAEREQVEQSFNILYSEWMTGEVG